MNSAGVAKSCCETEAKNSSRPYVRQGARSSVATPQRGESSEPQPKESIRATQAQPMATAGALEHQKLMSEGKNLNLQGCASLKGLPSRKKERENDRGHIAGKLQRRLPKFNQFSQNGVFGRDSCAAEPFGRTHIPTTKMSKATPLRQLSKAHWHSLPVLTDYVLVGDDSNSPTPEPKLCQNTVFSRFGA
jgi:hypothetical protein